MAFRSEAAAAAWERRQPSGRNGGAAVPVRVIGRLSAAWYAGRFDDDWRPSSLAAKQAILSAAGLQGAFWKLQSGGQRKLSSA